MLLFFVGFFVCVFFCCFFLGGAWVVVAMSDLVHDVEAIRGLC